MHQIHELISKRWSPVSFDRRPLEEESISLLFEAAKWAPSGFNAQPWRFVYASRGTAEFDTLNELLNPGNQVWAQRAPLLILPLAQKVSDYKNRSNRLAQYETGMAVGNLLVQATHLGLYTHQMGGYDHQSAMEVLEIPPEYEPMAMIAVGYLEDPSSLPAEVAERDKKERSRKENSAFVFPGKFSKDS